MKGCRRAWRGDQAGCRFGRYGWVWRNRQKAGESAVTEWRGFVGCITGRLCPESGKPQRTEPDSGRTSQDSRVSVCVWLAYRDGSP